MKQGTTNEAKGTIDQIVFTNVETGFRYPQLAEPAIRRQEGERAGQIFGIRRHWFPEQRDTRFTLDSREAFSGICDTNCVTGFITTKPKQEQYDFVVMLSTPQTHGHHQAAALFAADTTVRLPVDHRLVLIAAGASAAEPPDFRARPRCAVLRSDPAPRCRVSRLDPLPDQPSLSYNVVVNWAIAEHKSQGLFQTEAGTHAFEKFWLFGADTLNAARKADDLFASLQCQICSRQ